MRKCLLLIALCWLCFLPVAYTQVIKPPPPPSNEELARTGRREVDYYLNKWWWTLSLPQVRDRVHLEPGWSIETMPFDSSSNDIRAVYDIRTEDETGEVILYFEFPKTGHSMGRLSRRAYSYPTNHPLVTEWNADLKKLPFDDVNSRWIDILTLAKIQRSYNGGHVMYIVEMYIDESIRKK